MKRQVKYAIIKGLTKVKLENTMKHFMMLHCCVSRKTYIAGRPGVETVVAHGVAFFNSGASLTSDVMN